MAEFGVWPESTQCFIVICIFNFKFILTTFNPSTPMKMMPWQGLMTCKHDEIDDPQVSTSPTSLKRPRRSSSFNKLGLKYVQRSI